LIERSPRETPIHARTEHDVFRGERADQRIAPEIEIDAIGRAFRCRVYCRACNRAGAFPAARCDKHDDASPSPAFLGRGIKGVENAFNRKMLSAHGRPVKTGRAALRRARGWNRWRLLGAASPPAPVRPAYARRSTASGKNGAANRERARASA